MVSGSAPSIIALTVDLDACDWPEMLSGRDCSARECLPLAPWRRLVRRWECERCLLWQSADGPCILSGFDLVSFCFGDFKPLSHIVCSSEGRKWKFAENGHHLQHSKHVVVVILNDWGGLTIR